MMNTFTTTTALLLSSFAFAHGASNTPAPPAQYRQIQREMRANARQSAEHALTMARLATFGHSDSISQSQHAAELRDSVNETLNKAVKLSIQMPSEIFNSAEGLQLQQSILHLSAHTQATFHFLNETPNRTQTLAYQELLKQIQDDCQEIAE